MENPILRKLKEYKAKMNVLNDEIKEVSKDLNVKANKLQAMRERLNNIETQPEEAKVYETIGKTYILSNRYRMFNHLLQEIHILEAEMKAVTDFILALDKMKDSIQKSLLQLKFQMETFKED